MDPLGTLAAGLVNVENIARWSSSSPPDVLPAVDPLSTRQSPFPYNPAMNGIVCLWEGDIAALNAQAVTSATNEAMTDFRHPATRSVFDKAGPGLLQECRQQIQSCRTGEAKLSRGHNLPARHVIHTVGPRYNVKYRTAAESALYNCYRSVMQLAKEHHITTLAISVLHSTHRGYPADEGVHIALRTVRRFLEKWPDLFQTIIIAVEGTDAPIYHQTFSVYFPRSREEEQAVLSKVPEDIGNEEGEPVIADRQIRISDNPILLRGDHHDEESDEEGSASAAAGGDRTDLSDVGHHAFAHMAADQDNQRLEVLKGRTREETAAMEKQRRYQRLLRRARTEDMSDMARLRALYTSGVDFMGRPVVVIVARHFPATTIDMEKAISYFIHVLHPIVEKDYVVVYFHTMSDGDNHPELSVLRQMYDLVDNRYRKHLRSFYIVHPTLWSKLATWFFTTFTASSIKEKVQNMDGVQYLYDVINPDQLQIPQFVLDYDIQTNGLNYYTPQGRDGAGNSGL